MKMPRTQALSIPKATFVVGLVFATRADSCSERLPLLAESGWGLSDVGLRGWLGAAYHARGLYLLSTIELTNTGAILVVAPGRFGGWATGGLVGSVSHLRMADGARRPTRAICRPLCRPQSSGTLLQNPIKYRNASPKDSTHGK